MQRQIDKIKASGVVPGVHTAEVKAKSAKYKDEETGKAWDYVVNHYKQYGEHVIVLNPHKADQTPEGKFKCLYGDRAGVDAVIARAADEMQWSDDWRFSRIDFCFDLQCPYEDSDKLIRLFLLMAAKSAKLENLWMSDDPATLEMKNACARHEVHNTELAVEHYNRALKDQQKFDTVVINRLEFRTCGLTLTNCNGGRNMKAPVDLWLGIIDKAMTKKNLEAVEDEAARAFYRLWLKAKAVGGSQRIATFVRNNSGLVYTRRQLRQIFEIDLMDRGAADAEGKAGEAVKSLLKTGSKFEADLYTLLDLEEFSALLRNAVHDYFEVERTA